MKRLIKRFREWRDRRFAERVDRVYFRHDGKGNRYMEGILHAGDVIIQTKPLSVNGSDLVEEAIAGIRNIKSPEHPLLKARAVYGDAEISEEMSKRIASRL